MSLPIKIGTVAQLIRFIRGEKVILDRDIAQLYNIETRALKQAVKRNIKRFPRDFMFTLTESEVAAMVSQNVIPSKKYFGGSKPMAFTEQGVAILPAGRQGFQAFLIVKEQLKLILQS